jgi:transketolase
MGGPVVLALSRQNLPVMADPDKVFSGAQKGAYVVESDDRPDLVLIGTGSEVQLAVGAASKLRGEGIKVSVVSMPSWELFEAQSQDYRESVIPPSTCKVAIEAGITLGWQKYVGSEGAIIGIDRFGASAPGDKVMQEFGFTVDNVCAVARTVVHKASARARASKAGE